MKEPKRISTGYIPRKHQAELHGKLKRFNVIVCHRRFGKTIFGVNETIDQATRNHRVSPGPRYAYLAPFRDQAKRIAWEYQKQYTENIPFRDPNEAELRVDIPTRATTKDKLVKARLMILGADNPMALKGIYLDGGILDEFGEMHPSAWTEAIRPTLSDYSGWTIFTGTPKGRNHLFDLYEYATKSGDPEWFGAMFKASETGIISQSELDSARRVMSEEEYMQEYECSFSAGLVGAYFSRELDQAEKEKRFTDIPYDPAVPVETYWDLGMNDTTAVWCVQKVGFQFRAIDYFEAPDLSIPEWTKKLRERPYNYGTCFLPHDAAARDIGTGKTRQETFRSSGWSRTKIIPRQEKMDSIHACRMIFPKCWFDKTRCEAGIKALQNYQRRWDKKQNVFSEKPLHNWASNGADAFQAFAMGAQDRPSDYDLSDLPTVAETSYNPFSRRLCG